MFSSLCLLCIFAMAMIQRIGSYHLTQPFEGRVEAWGDDDSSGDERRKQAAPYPVYLMPQIFFSSNYKNPII